MTIIYLLLAVACFVICIARMSMVAFFFCCLFAAMSFMSAVFNIIYDPCQSYPGPPECVQAYYEEGAP